jgi:hypothetical protein
MAAATQITGAISTNNIQRRAFVNDGGHLCGAQFNGVGEQINYVPQHMGLNQRRARLGRCRSRSARGAKKARTRGNA